MTKPRFEEQCRLLATHRDALVVLLDGLEDLESELNFLACDTDVLVEHPKVAIQAGLVDGIKALDERIGKCGERSWETKQKVVAALASANAALEHVRQGLGLLN
ncbi:hypothetical protein [Niveibacterium sp.]|uniref:hypothetical protein n=1 Tax=Niveibacterium sp. TaxID=2017444 RepID=UPI0035B0FEDF